MSRSTQPSPGESAGPAGPAAPAGRARAAFRRAFGGASDPRVAVAPGRVNLVGGHTDYNDGFVLPAAVDRYVAVAFAPADAGASFRVRAEDMDTSASFGAGELRPGAHRGWLAYVAGTVWALREAGVGTGGLSLAVAGSVPVGAGLGSSAALEMGLARALFAASGTPWDPVAAARAGRRAENDYVGVSTGIMDQLVSASAREGDVLLLDCRTLERRAVPLPEAASVLVLDTGVRRELAASAYDEHRAACRRAVDAIRGRRPDVRALRDVDPALLREAGEELDREARRRARHVVEENRRTRQAADALAAGDLEVAGRLMGASHASLRDLYEVSSEELDLVVEAATGREGCYGARMTGAGFGGCAVALVRRDAGGAVADAVAEAYRGRFDHPFRAFACRPAAGARLL